MMLKSKPRTEAQMTTHMTKVLPHVSDSIEFKSINTGGQSVGNGGDGYFKGSISNEPTIKFDPSNKASGADVKVITGDQVSQKAYWEAEGGDAKASKYSKAYGGDANSNGDQSSKSGHDTSKVYADTTADQKNYLWADQHQEVAAGIGGHGGDGDVAWGGNVSFDLGS
jgi:hypothetical protein